MTALPDRSWFSTGNPWERSVGFSRAVRVGQTVYTAGTLASDADGQIHGEDCFAQCCYIFEKLRCVLEEAGTALEHVVKVSAFVVGNEDVDGFTRAHSMYMGEVRPATTCVMVSALFHPLARVEIELTAVIPV
jgi:enamine deaminase RidA (YjgF/YER057c/UK114 family)